MLVLRRVCKARYFALLLLIVAIAAVAMTGLRPFHITNPSMHPKIDVGTIVFSTPQERYEIGDDIVFIAPVVRYMPDGRKVIVPSATTHRLVRIEPDGRYVTKGHANAANDPTYWDIRYDDVIGRVHDFKIPLLGSWFEPRFWEWQIRQKRFLIGVLLIVSAVGWYLMSTRQTKETS